MLGQKGREGDTDDSVMTCDVYCTWALCRISSSGERITRHARMSSDVLPGTNTSSRVGHLFFKFPFGRCLRTRYRQSFPCSRACEFRERRSRPSSSERVLCRVSEVTPRLCGLLDRKYGHRPMRQSRPSSLAMCCFVEVSVNNFVASP